MESAILTAWVAPKHRKTFESLLCCNNKKKNLRMLPTKDLDVAVSGRCSCSTGIVCHYYYFFWLVGLLPEDVLRVVVRLPLLGEVLS